MLLLKKQFWITAFFLFINIFGYSQKYDTTIICFSDMGNASYKIFYENKLIGRVESSKQKEKHNFIRGFSLFHMRFHWYKKFSIHYIPLLIDSVSLNKDSIQLVIFRKPFLGMKYSKANYIFLDRGSFKKYLIFSIMYDVSNDRKKKEIFAFWSCCKPRFD